VLKPGRILLAVFKTGGMKSMNCYADKIFIKGNVYTVDKFFSKASAIAVRGGNIMWAGADDQAEKYIGSGTAVVDLDGLTVLPGLIESHMHVLMYGEKLMNIDCFGKTKTEILREVKTAYENACPGQWITGAGWDETKWAGKKLPAKEELDEVSPDIPVFLTRVCTHLSWANSAALMVAGIDGKTADPAGGEIHRTPSGDATGVLVDTAANIVQRLAPPMEGLRREKAYILAQSDLLANGFTAVHDLALWEPYDMNSIKFIARLYEKGLMKISISSYISAEHAEEIYELGPFSGAFGGKFSMRGVKIFADGSLGARSAWLLDDYADRSGHRGNCRYSDEELYAMMYEARKNGFQITTHAIGDAANNQVINIYDRLLKNLPEPADHRLRIEHAQILRRDDMKRLLELGVIPSMQFTQCTSDIGMTEKRIGDSRLEGTYAWRELIDGGAVIPGGSDAPVELINPFHGIYAAVSRKNRSGQPDGGWRPEQKITRKEAIRAFTIWGAYASFEERIRGSIEIGKKANLTIIDRDVMSCPEEEIKDTNVVATILSGEKAYGEFLM